MLPKAIISSIGLRPATPITRRGANLRAWRGRVEVEEEGAFADRRGAGTGHRHRLARGDRRYDQVGVGGERRVRRRRRHAVGGRMRAQRRGFVRARIKLEVVRADRDALGAQILGQDLADLDVADEAHAPVHRVDVHLGQSMYFSPALASGSRMEYMSRPSTPAASFARLAPSLASRARAASSVLAASARGTHTTPSSSATITSPGFTSAPAHTTGTLTEPSVALTVPLAEIVLLQTGNFISASVLTSRTPASITSARAPRAMKLVASRSPKYPSLHS